MIGNGRRKAFAGVGSREAPRTVLKKMEVLAERLARRGMVLRSGAARGADMAFEKGCDTAAGAKEIFLPWDGFSPWGRGGDGRRSVTERGVMTPPDWEKALRITEEHWDASERPFVSLRQGTQKLMGRNACQVLGADLETPAVAVLYWTPEPERGGTTQALRVARAHGIECIRIDEGKDVGALVEQLDAMT